MTLKRVLIFDDDQEVLGILKEALTYSKFDVQTENDAAGFDCIIDEYKPDIILMDYLLKGINGGDICYQIKHNPKTSHLPVILISAYPRVFQSLGSYDCDIFIEKPFDLNDLVARINECLLTLKLNTGPKLIH